MKTEINIETDFSLQNINNFNKTFDVNINNDIMNKYVELVIEYLKLILENIKIQNLQYSKFIIIRGLETITNVFNIILYYTKNINITYFQCQKAFYYYIEFIEQITEEQHTFLQLSSRDAIIYVYKKTCYEIPNDFKKNMLPLTKEIIERFDLINAYLKIYKIVLLKIINDDSQFNLKKIHNFELFYNKLNNLKIEIDNLNILESIIAIFNNKINKLDVFFEIVLLYLSKINKKIDKINKYKDKIYLEEFDSHIEEEDAVDNFVTWFIN
jgi:hypothetical protein